MAISDDLSSLSSDIGKGGMSESAIRSRLSTIEDQAKAQEADIEAKLANIQHLEKRITHLETKLNKQHLEESGRLKADTEKILKEFFDAEGNDDDGILTFEYLARKLGMQLGILKGHCDVLFEREMIHWAGIECAYIISGGRKYVMDYLLS